MSTASKASGASRSAGTQKHTRGPWRIDGQTIRDLRMNPIAYTESDYHTMEQEDANARLIAAAPDLLEFAALVARMRTLEEFGDGDDAPQQDDWIETLGELIASARVVVAKAQGATKETP